MRRENRANEFIASFFIAFLIFAGGIAMLVFTVDKLDRLNSQEVLSNGTNLGEVTSITPSEYYCVVEVNNNSEYSLSGARICEHVETGQSVYKRNDETDILLSGQKLWVFTQEEVRTGVAE